MDTSVFTAALGGDPGGLAARYERYLKGARLVISFQTEAEVRYGALKIGWEPKRLAAMDQRLSEAVLIPPHDRLVVEWALLRNECRQVGHALHDKHHAADLWVAATARLAGMALVTHDSIFDGTPGLTVIREP